MSCSMLKRAYQLTPKYVTGLLIFWLCCLAIIQKAIEEAGRRIDDVVRTRIMLTDMMRWQEAAKAHDEVFGDIRPACTFVEVGRLIKEDWLVEIEADCIVA